MCNKNKIYVIFYVVFFVPTILFAQKNAAVFKDAIKAERDSFYNKIVRSINRTITLPLDSTTDEQWQSAFYNIALINYKNEKVNASILKTSKTIATQSDDCKKAFVNFVNAIYPKKYFNVVKNICETTTDTKLFAMCIHYMLISRPTSFGPELINEKLSKALSKNPNDAILHELNVEVNHHFNRIDMPSISAFFDKNYLPNTQIVFSFQRVDRNYPGLAIIRKADGTFVKNNDSTFFSVGQLALSLSNMPGYITNGNTPQGIFKMNGFDTSTNYFIGPTTNIQLAMPHEYNAVNINGDVVDTTFTLAQYKNLLPLSFQSYAPLYGTFYAGKAGRTEIIAHGTTINPAYYKNNSYFPYTPTMGCLTSIEIWNSNTGLLQKSNQQKLTSVLQKNGSAFGYLIVIELDAKDEAVTLKDISKYLKNNYTNTL